MKSADETDARNILQIILFTVDVVVIIVTQFSLIIFVVILCRKRSFQAFHPNLTIIFLNQATTYSVFLLPRCVFAFAHLITGQHFNNNRQFYALTVMWNIGLNSMGLNLAAFTIERIFAIALYSIYETWCSRIPYLAIIILLIQWFYSISSSTLSLEGYISNAVLVSTLLTVYAIAMLMFTVLPRISRSIYNRYQRRTETLNSYSLSERYQLSENIHSARVLNSIILFICATSLSGAALYWLINYRYYTTRLRWPLEICLDLLACFQSIGVCVMALRSKEILYAQLRAFMCRSRKVSDFVPKTVTGRTLVIPVEHERQAYFDAYSKAWNQV
uniref:G protein-coupled receptor n=2 Tax=Ascaris lumbricoides TaxID=6252 RepID=A0A0M3IB76_ASCLU